MKLTQRDLGRRAGIVDKYVSEIERGTRDVPVSTLYMIVERGLDSRIDFAFRPRDAKGTRIEEALSRLSVLPADVQTRIADILLAVLDLRS